MSGPAFPSGSGLDQQIARAHQVVGGQGKGPDPGDALPAPVSSFSQKANGLGPAKDLSGGMERRPSETYMA